jgi:TRAP-type mannitol/chloroaromatic compound transport system permease small subunit
VTLLLKLSQLIDWLNERVGKGAFWLVLVMTIISAGNATYRFIFNDSSNGLLEIQWYCFAAVFLLCSPYTLQKNEHVRIDVLSATSRHAAWPSSTSSAPSSSCCRWSSPLSGSPCR